MAEPRPSPDPVDTAAAPRWVAAPYIRERPRLSYVEPEDPWARRAFVGGLERLFGRRRLERIYEALKAEPFDPERFFDRALDLAGIETELRSESGAALPVPLPAEGPLILIGNHPWGIVDGVIMCQLAARARGDFRILLHARLCQDADLAPYFLPVDFEESRQAMRTNIASKRAALETLAAGGTLVIFPGGGVATAPGGFGVARELPWSTFAAKLVQQSRATVVPVYFHGQNSRLFHLASAVSETLRTALLLYEARNKFGRRFAVSVGAPIPFEDLEHLGSRAALTAHLQDRIEALGAPDGPDRSRP